MWYNVNGEKIMRFLCVDVVNDIVLPLVILAGGIAIAVAIYFSLRKKVKHDCRANHFDQKASVEVSLKKSYVTEESMKFLEYLHRAMPKELIAFPKVGVDQIVVPKKDKVAFNAILSKYVDICVFVRKTMEPVMVVDLVASNASVEQYNEMDTNVVAVLKAVKVPVLRVKIEEGYDIEALRANILNVLPAKVVSGLKENYINTNLK